MSRLPDLEAWAIFAKVVETGSFAQAAAELSLSQATVSKAISRLEARMNTALLHRTSRRMTLTESGETALERAGQLLEAGASIEADITDQSTRLRGRIRMSAPMSFGIAHLAPVLPDFMHAHPDIELDVHFDDQHVDLIADRFDLALRIGSLADSSLLARRLCHIHVLLVGAPEYFDRHGRPAHPRDLAHHKALHYSYARHGAHWRFHHPTEGSAAQSVPASLHANSADALTPMLLSGLGLALQPEFMVWRDIDAGRLETVMAPWALEPVAMHLVTPPGRRRPARVNALIDFLGQQFSNAPWAH